MSLLLVVSVALGPTSSDRTARAQATPSDRVATSHGADAPAPRAGTLAAALAAARATNYADAERQLAAIQGADRPAARLALARILFEQGRLGDADKHAAEAVASADVRLAALALRAQILASEGKVDQAIHLLEPAQGEAGAGGRRVRLVLGELLIASGRRADAEPVLLKFADEYDNDAIGSNDAEGLAMVGRAMHLLRHAKDANRAFNESERAERGRVETLLWRAELYIDKNDPGHAEEVLTEALKIAPHRADAIAMLARLKVDQALDFEAADKLVTEALGVDPKSARALAVRAGIALRDMNIAAADAAIDAGLGAHPADLELLSLRAAARFLADDKAGFDAAKRGVFARNREFSRAYAIIGEHAEWEHRYDDVIAMMKEAVAMDAKDANAWAELGLMQTRAGDEPAGIKSLEQAWREDHFDVRVYNTLQLLYKQWIPEQYEQATSGVFSIRYPKDERKVLERYVPRMLSEAWGAMKGHYGFTPAQPVAVEMYRDRQQFSVRTSGLPNIGIQGVCFGHVVAAMSPNSEPFNWGNVLWHELGHVFAIQLSKNHVPRWFTEGLSEYETSIRRPEWQRELDPELYAALKKGVLPRALDMNSAFTHAEGELDVTVAYYAASQMLAFTAETFGFPAITRALALWGQGRTTADVIHAAFGVTPDDYDARFRAWAKKRLVRYDGQYMFSPPSSSLDDARAAASAAPSDVHAQVALAVALIRAQKVDEASHAIDAALKLAPNDADAHFVGSKIAALTKDPAKQQAHLAAMQAAGADGYAVQMALAELAEGRHDRAAARAALEAAHRFDPSQADPLRGLFDLATEEKRDGDALDALRAIALLDQHDRHVWRLLMDKLVAAQKWDEARRTGESALFVDVESAGIHVDYARALAAGGDHRGAAYELESAVLCDAKPEEKAQAHALLAREEMALGDAGAARAHRDEALRLDPTNADARSLKL